MYRAVKANADSKVRVKNETGAGAQEPEPGYQDSRG